MHVVYGLFDSYTQADRAVIALLQSGFTKDNVSVMAREESLPHVTAAHENITDGAAEGATAGAAIGGITGLLAGLGALTIPGFGPILAAGPIISALSSVVAGAGVGAVAGGIVGALVDWGIPDNVASVYAEGIEEGGVLLAVEVQDDEQEEEVKEVMMELNAEEINAYEVQRERIRA